MAEQHDLIIRIGGTKVPFVVRDGHTTSHISSSGHVMFTGLCITKSRMKVEQSAIFLHDLVQWNMLVLAMPAGSPTMLRTGYYADSACN